MQQLAEYLKSQGLTPEEFASVVGAHASTIRRIIAGTRRPGPKLVIKIYSATGGKVTPNDFHDLSLKSVGDVSGTAQDKPEVSINGSIK